MKNSKSGSSHPKAARLVSVNNMPSYAAGQAVTEYKLHLVMDKESLVKLRCLKASLDASSDSEVIRRALYAYQLFEPHDVVSNAETRKGEKPTCAIDDQEHLYIRISPRVKELLDTERETSGLSYGEQVRHALRVLTQIERERAKVLRSVKSDSPDDLVCQDIIGAHGRIRAVC